MTSIVEVTRIVADNTRLVVTNQQLTIADFDAVALIEKAEKREGKQVEILQSPLWHGRYRR